MQVPAAEPAPSSSAAAPSGAAPEAPIADGLIAALSPIATCDDGMRSALESQAALAQQLERATVELQSFLAMSQLPDFSPHAARLADVRRRVAVTSGTLGQVQARLQRLEELADQLAGGGGAAHARRARGSPGTRS